MSKKNLEHHITVIINATANATEIQIIHALEESTAGSKKLSETKRKLKTLESELSKPNPSEKVIRKVMRCTSGFGLQLFLRLAVLVAERWLKPM